MLKVEDSELFVAAVSIFRMLSPFAKISVHKGKVILYSVERSELASAVLVLENCGETIKDGVLRITAISTILRHLKSVKVYFEDSGSLVINGASERSGEKVLIKIGVLDLDYPPPPDFEDYSLSVDVDSDELSGALNLLSASSIEELLFDVKDESLNIVGKGLGIVATLTLKTRGWSLSSMRFLIPSSYARILKLMTGISNKVSISWERGKPAFFTVLSPHHPGNKLHFIVSAREHEQA